jgi:hypothetical protein
LAAEVAVVAVGEAVVFAAEEAVDSVAVAEEASGEAVSAVAAEDSAVEVTAVCVHLEA